MPISSATADLEAYRLMRGGNFRAALLFAERAVSGKHTCVPACDRAIALDPTQYPSYLLRSELRVQARDANHVSELQTLLARPDLEYQGTTVSCCHLMFDSGGSFERQLPPIGPARRLLHGIGARRLATRQNRALPRLRPIY